MSLMHRFSYIRKENMLELKDSILKIEGEDYEKELAKVVKRFAFDKGLREKTVWGYYEQMRETGMVK